MSDLIDLQSPEGKTVCSKLTSPLIPAPSNFESAEGKKIDPARCALIRLSPSRNSLDNNPFDNAHYKTVEYVRNREDPFELALEKARTYNEYGKGGKSLMEDVTPRKKRSAHYLKKNRSFGDGPQAAERVFDNANKTASAERNNAACGAGNRVPEVAQGRRDKIAAVPQLRVHAASLETSILNQSAMNDSLTDVSSDSQVSKSMIDLKLSQQLRSADVDSDALDPNFLMAQSRRLRRTLSQGDRLSPRKSREPRSQSIVNEYRVEANDSSFDFAVPTIIFEDSINKAFIGNASADSASTGSGLSGISGIARNSSVSSGVSSVSSCAYADSTINRAFIGNSHEDSGGKGLERTPSDSAAASRDKRPVERCRDEKSLDDIISKYSLLKNKSGKLGDPHPTSPPLPCKSINGSSAIPRAEANPPVDNKLIDVDVLEEKKNSPANSQKNCSNSSSDSVFADDENIEKLIINEAKRLANVFEELAFVDNNSTSTSGSDDLVNSRLQVNFDMLPPSDDEEDVEDLIQLPKSPCKPEEKTNTQAKAVETSSKPEIKSEKSMIKELEAEFINPEKKIVTSTLLFDLEKIVESENNPKAAELLKSLEKALGVKCQSNTDLLATCLSVENNSNSDSKSVENSLEDGKTLDGSENNQCENNLSFPREKNSLMTPKIPKMRKKTAAMADEKKSNEPEMEKQLLENRDQEYLSDESDAGDFFKVTKEHNQITDDQKMAVELSVALGKILTGDNGSPIIANLLNILGVSRNLTSPVNCVADLEKKHGKEKTRVATPIKTRVATPPRRFSPVANFSRMSEKTYDSNAKVKSIVERVIRRSTSITNSVSNSTPSSPRLANHSLYADKTKSHLQDGRKRYPSDPGTEIHRLNNRNISRDITLKPVEISDLAKQRKSSSVMAGDVKTKLKKKVESNMGIKKGPMKAIHSLGTMQRMGSFGKNASLNGSITPPGLGRAAPSDFSLSTSTPFPSVNLSIPKKKSKSKPMASSTPDEVSSRYNRRSAPIFSQGLRSCNISPVTSKKSEFNNDHSGQNNSNSSKNGKLASPSRPRPASQLPKLSPLVGAKSAAREFNNAKRRSEPLQTSFLPNNVNTPKSPRGRLVRDGSASPLNNSNKLGPRGKTVTLTPKLRGRKSSFADKENYV